mmetsp:Transcript_29477/g.54697  ORF Transcript_29477/g.54697 Transcript_29477/m.54697 type:complete len:425 (-) Transcript_29477:212-1486(-)|eukprot:CAMPEP_0197440860 /NCGR_PEP_ID=MMETSP1175-20131217/7254_1 /TAXON_ID=1003142 /ORGANISM="Triceratium dubium, Strain CCMP147" /LENGTH=424 /DNA_ID=CAMNT_0042971041 /DNA_START=118 /DNA_END=1392 /DNA_ORIENTATION=+
MVRYANAAVAVLGFLSSCDVVVGGKKKDADIDNMAYADCEEYCEKYGTVCGDLFFSKDGCMADCRMFPRTDVPPVYDLSFDPIDLGSDTINCRATHLSFAIEFGGGGDVYQARKSPDAAFHCGHASPGGEGICTDYDNNDGLNNPFRLMQSGGNFKFGACRVTEDKKVANCMRSDLTDDSVVGALKVLPSSTEHLFLHRNNLTYVPEDIADMFPNLKSLYLDGNYIASVSPKDFDGLDELEILSFNENPVTELDRHLLRGTPNLKTFSFFFGVSGITTITKIPKHFFQHTKGIVNIIMYGHKGLTKFDKDVFKGLTECKIISFVDCNFTWEGFPKGVFDDLVSLEYFDFFINNFTGPIPGDLFGPWAKNVFRTVFWGNPGIDGIEDGAFDNLENVKKIFLHWTGVSADDVAGVVPSSVEALTLP